MTKDFDFKIDKPSWPLSSYGPAKLEKNLLPPLDESPEELRFKAVTAMRNGTISEYVRTLIAFYRTIPKSCEKAST
jgi:nucleoporin NUP42